MEKAYYIEFDESVFAARIPFKIIANEGICSRESSHLFTLRTEKSIDELNDLLTSAGFERREFNVYDEEEAVLLTR